VSTSSYARVETIAIELARLQDKHFVRPEALVRRYLREAEAEGVLAGRVDGEYTEADLDLLYEYLHGQVLLCTFAVWNQHRDLYAEAHRHLCHAAMEVRVDRAILHLKLAGTAVAMLARASERAPQEAPR